MYWQVYWIRGGIAHLWSARVMGYAEAEATVRRCREIAFSTRWEIRAFAFGDAPLA